MRELFGYASRPWSRTRHVGNWSHQIEQQVAETENGKSLVSPRGGGWKGAMELIHILHGEERRRIVVGDPSGVFYAGKHVTGVGTTVCCDGAGCLSKQSSLPRALSSICSANLGHTPSPPPLPIAYVEMRAYSLSPSPASLCTGAPGMTNQQARSPALV